MDKNDSWDVFNIKIILLSFKPNINCLMKNTFLAVLCTIGFLGAMAQSDSKSSFKKGIRAGWHYSGMFRNGSQSFDNLNSFYFGLNSEYKASALIYTGSGLEYFQNGFTSGGENFKAHIISLPFYIKPKLGPLYGTAGFALNFKLGDNREDFPNVVGDTRFFDLPVQLGLGASLGPVAVEARYNWGLFDAANINGQAHKYQYLQVGGALRF